MSDKLKYIDHILDDWKNPEYKGLRKPAVDKYKNNPIEEILSYRTSIDKISSPTLTYNKRKISSYTPDQEGLRDFLNDYNFRETKKLDLKNPSFFRIEGSSTDQHLTEHNKYINDNTEHIMEVGFNAGISAINFLKNSNAKVVSFDIGLHSYCWYAKMFIDYMYPGRHTLIIGDSLITVPQYIFPYERIKELSIIGGKAEILEEENKINITKDKSISKKFDIIFIDGYHSTYYAKQDMLNAKHLADENTILILDNVSPHNNSGVGPYIAMNMLMEEGDITFIRHVEIEPDYSDGFAVLKYKFDMTPKPESLLVEDYKYLERKIPIYLLSDYIEENKQHINKGKFSNKPQTESNKKLIRTVEEYLNMFKEAGLETDKWLMRQYESL